MNRIGEIKLVLETIDEPMTPHQIHEQTEIPVEKLNSGMLNELREYGIVERVRGSGGGTASLWTVKKPSNIERLKDDMMGATA
jgi:DNA-binding IscR family transcriptional regulator